MGNTLREQHGETSTLFPSSILAQTSLHPLCYKSYAKSCSGAISTNDTRINTLDALSERKDRSNCPELRSGEKNGCRVDEKGDLTKDHFKILKVLGCEGLGKMYLVKKGDEEKMYTMKTIDKRKIASLGCIDSIESERVILEKANHPFIPKLRYTFENDKKIFFVFDQIEGEKLNIVLHHLTKFSEEITRFYAAEIIVALEYLHKEMKTSYQDLEIENIRLDNEGHINLIDFAKTKSLDLDNISSEKMNKRKMIDFYHLGCLIYELLAGKKIYHSEEDMKNALKEKNTETNLTWPKHVSKTARDLITRLLTQKTEERLGYNNIEEIKKHPFFDGIKWEKIQQKLMYPPISPPKREEGCDMENEESCFSFTELDDIIDKENRKIKPEIKRRITT